MRKKKRAAGKGGGPKKGVEGEGLASAILRSTPPYRRFQSAGEDELPVFEDVTKQAGIDFQHSFGSDHLSNIVEGTGSGWTFFDYDGDGWLDIYLVNGRYRPDVNDNSGRKYRGKLTNKLYRNNHDGTFTDVTEKAGVGGGDSYGVACSAADYDHDGHLDLLVLNYGPPILYHNNGDGTFTDVTKKAGSGRRSQVGRLGSVARLQQRRLAGPLYRALPSIRCGQVPFLLSRGRLSGPAELQRQANACIGTTATARSRT